MALQSYLLLAAAPLAAALVALVVLLRRRAFDAAVFLTLGISLAAVVVYYSPNMVLRRDGCHLDFGRRVWARVGDAPLFLYIPDDSIRGSIPFSQNRLAREINLSEQLRQVPSSSHRAFVLAREEAYARERKTSATTGLDLQVTFLDGDDHTGTSRRYVLMGNGHGRVAQAGGQEPPG
jgi:hypothetical protein